MPGLSPGKPIRNLTTTVVVSPELVAALVPLLLPPLVPLLVAPLLPVIAPVLPALAPVLVPSVVPALVAPLVPILAPAIIPAVVPVLVPLLAPALVPPVLSAITPLVVASFNTRTGPVSLLSSDVTGALTFTPAGLTTNTFTGLQTLSGGLTVSSGAVSLGNGAGSLLGFFGTAPIVKQVSGENLTNNVTPSGINGVIPNLVLDNYSNDGPKIREALYQLARKVKQLNDSLRLYGILT